MQESFVMKNVFVILHISDEFRSVLNSLNENLLNTLERKLQLESKFISLKLEPFLSSFDIVEPSELLVINSHIDQVLRDFQENSLNRENMKNSQDLQVLKNFKT